jgi:L-rhamnose-H+ transport protein
MLYCLYLHKKHNTFKEYSGIVSKKNNSGLSLNFAMAALTGFLWYGQFFFYGLGHVRMGNYKFSSWAIHMIMLVLFSSIAGLILKEWMRSNPRTIRLLALALFVLVVSVVIITYGNYLGTVAGS